MNDLTNCRKRCTTNDFDDSKRGTSGNVKARGGSPLTEAQHQQCVIKWTQQPHIRAKYPELKLLYHIPNERKCSQVQGRLLKLQGVKSGVPDLHLPVARRGFHGLYIEMKTETGRTSDNQDWWIYELEKQGYCCAVCHGWQDAVSVLEGYLCG